MAGKCYGFATNGNFVRDHFTVPCEASVLGGYANCCNPGDFCLSQNLCKTDGSDDYYVARCTDPTGEDPLCTAHCDISKYTDVVYEGFGEWRCCYSENGGSCYNPKGPWFPGSKPRALTTSPVRAGHAGIPSASAGVPPASSHAPPNPSPTPTPSPSLIPTPKPTTSSKPDSSNSHLGVEVGVPVGIVIVIIAIVTGVLFYRRRNRGSKEPSPELPPEIVKYEPKKDEGGTLTSVFSSSPIQQTPAPAYSSFAAVPSQMISPYDNHTVPEKTVGEKNPPPVPPASGFSYKAGPYDSLMPPAELPGDQGASEVDGTSASRASASRPGIVSMTSELSDPGSEPRSAVSEMPSPGLSATGEQKPLV